MAAMMLADMGATVLRIDRATTADLGIPLAEQYEFTRRSRAVIHLDLKQPAAVGAALALRGSGRLPVAVCGDGDFLMGATAIWTAVHYNIPLLVVVANNRSFFNDELHQERVARMRNRPVENRWIGQRIADPEIDVARLAQAQGAQGFGPITDDADLAATFRGAIEAVEGGAVAVVDVRIAPGYAPAAVAALFRA